ncbi:hypothetical protein METUNv1_01146 [Methyloversatilis universalis FAM5]|uniref:DUF883 domain-containing protein n=1 Tax=Methyloversatilis universalis (strain ATCC BAA-1314 / DSM 25237 / JCM 13912 / CCUG 52030 / FAM5) TaxID=1000565 RepID=F5RA66_METUF|nr:DUF883 family protein [Methyloversatilis universalis]EGK72382.1 hypothetical protein METUNv1_01146 [Methyloversatilis universalis FAM5]
MNIETNPLHSALDSKKDGGVKDWRIQEAASDGATVPERVDASLDEAKTRLHNAGVALAGTTRRVADATQGYVNEHPWRAMALAAAAGLLAALLIRRH